MPFLWIPHENPKNNLPLPPAQEMASGAASYIEGYLKQHGAGGFLWQIINSSTAQAFIWIHPCSREKSLPLGLNSRFKARVTPSVKWDEE